MVISTSVNYRLWLLKSWNMKMLWIYFDTPHSWEFIWRVVLDTLIGSVPLLKLPPITMTHIIHIALRRWMLFQWLGMPWAGTQVRLLHQQHFKLCILKWKFKHLFAQLLISKIGKVHFTAEFIWPPWWCSYISSVVLHQFLLSYTFSRQLLYVIKLRI